MVFIEAKDLHFAYSAERGEVIKGIDLQIEKGSYVAIIGHNGCGKSTLAKLLCGIIAPTHGSVTVSGIDTSDEDMAFELRTKCGMVFQNPDNQLVASIVEEDVAFAPENLSCPREEIRRRVDECLATVDMTSYAHHATYKLSGGQKQRVAIAGILAMSPECIVFDEATAMLDPTGRKEIIRAMKKLNAEMGMTVITITHHMNEAVEADRIIVMNSGRIFMEGTPEQVFSEVEALSSVSLAVPQVTELMFALEKEGYPCRRGILHAMDAADETERLFGR